MRMFHEFIGNVKIYCTKLMTYPQGYNVCPKSASRVPRD